MAIAAAEKEYEAIDTHHGHNFLLLIKAHHINIGGFPTPGGGTHSYPADLFSMRWLGLEAKAEESLVSDLHSLVALEKDERGRLHLRPYHKSFSDFLEDQSRAEDLFVPKARVYAHVAKCFTQHIINSQLDFDSGA